MKKCKFTDETVKFTGKSVQNKKAYNLCGLYLLFDMKVVSSYVVLRTYYV